LSFLIHLDLPSAFVFVIPLKRGKFCAAKQGEVQTKTTAPFDALHNTKQDDMNYQFDNKKYLLSVVTVHVRWPARPAELRAGLDFFGSFCIKAKRT
jgi:hypothetical protein